MQEKKQKFFTSWFYKWFLNNQAASFLLVCLLVLVNLFLFNKVGYVVKPIVSFVEIILLPMILTGSTAGVQNLAMLPESMSRCPPPEA